ncbi:TetR/AcrR family transcriptional regulator [Pseudonocardia xishanensis]|uniref:TetR/AcrR family transcriptional regulator n=1 Tax=Pseudonocardia xishanensis TaxID=630995 RepID=A0ABP8RGN2_9PSEU
MADQEPRSRPGGRSARVRRAVLEASAKTIRDHGFEAFAIKDVAAEAGVHETSIYRRWGTREALILDALLDDSAQNVPIPDTGSLRGDLTTLANGLADFLDTPHGRALSLALMTGTGRSVDGIRDYLGRRLSIAGEVVHRAVRRGEVSPTTDPIVVIEALIGPLHFRAFMFHQKPDEAFVDRLVDLIITGTR